MGGSSPGTTSVHTLATPPTTSRLSIHPHLGRKSPSARAQIPNVVASSFVEMAPAAFACSATSCERARLSPRSRCPSAHLVARGRLHPAPLCLPVSAPTSRSPDFLGGQSSQLRTPTPPPPPPPAKLGAVASRSQPGHETRGPPTAPHVGPQAPVRRGEAVVTVSYKSPPPEAQRHVLPSGRTMQTSEDSVVR